MPKTQTAGALGPLRGAGWRVMSAIGHSRAVGHRLPSVKRQPPPVGCQPPSHNRILSAITSGRPSSKNNKQNISFLNDRRDLGSSDTPARECSSVYPPPGRPHTARLDVALHAIFVPRGWEHVPANDKGHGRKKTGFRGLRCTALALDRLVSSCQALTGEAKSIGAPGTAGPPRRGGGGGGGGSSWNRQLIRRRTGGGGTGPLVARRFVGVQSRRKLLPPTSVQTMPLSRGEGEPSKVESVCRAVQRTTSRSVKFGVCCPHVGTAQGGGGGMELARGTSASPQSNVGAPQVPVVTGNLQTDGRPGRCKARCNADMSPCAPESL